MNKSFPRACGDEPVEELTIELNNNRFPRACGDEPSQFCRDCYCR